MLTDRRHHCSTGHHHPVPAASVTTGRRCYLPAKGLVFFSAVLRHCYRSAEDGSAATHLAWMYLLAQGFVSLVLMVVECHRSNKVARRQGIVLTALVVWMRLEKILCLLSVMMPSPRASISDLVFRLLHHQIFFSSSTGFSH